MHRSQHHSAYLKLGLQWYRSEIDGNQDLKAYQW